MGSRVPSCRGPCCSVECAEPVWCSEYPFGTRRCHMVWPGRASVLSCSVCAFGAVQKALPWLLLWGSLSILLNPHLARSCTCPRPRSHCLPDFAWVHMVALASGGDIEDPTVPASVHPARAASMQPVDCQRRGCGARGLFTAPYQEQVGLVARGCTPGESLVQLRWQTLGPSRPRQRLGGDMCLLSGCWW